MNPLPAPTHDLTSGAALRLAGDVIVADEGTGQFARYVRFLRDEGLGHDDIAVATDLDSEYRDRRGLFQLVISGLAAAVAAIVLSLAISTAPTIEPATITPSVPAPVVEPVADVATLRL